MQNCAARVLSCTKSWQHITSTLICLHWLPVKSCITYKIILLTYKSLPNICLTSSTLYPVSQAALIKHRQAFHPLHQTANLQWQSLLCDSPHSLEHSPSWLSKPPWVPRKVLLNVLLLIEDNNNNENKNNNSNNNYLLLIMFIMFLLLFLLVFFYLVFFL